MTAAARDERKKKLATQEQLEVTMIRQPSVMLALTLSLFLAACGGGGSSSTPGAVGPAGTNGLSALTFVSTEAAGPNCATDGVKVVAGLDRNGNGILDAAEIASTQFVCNGAAGATGPTGATGSTGLVRLDVEPAGVNCTYGGNKISVGVDANRSGVLDASEVSSSSYVCQGAPGATGATGSAGPAGAPGTAGMPGLISVLSESAGANCMYGGNKITSGLDSNGNSVLDTPEVTSTSYSCNGAPGATGATGAAGSTGATGAAGLAGADGRNALTALSAEPAGTNCSYGGARISAGLDSNTNGILDSSEVTSVSYSCTGAQGATGSIGATGANGFSTLVRLTAEPAGANCTSGGTQVSAGLDANGNSVLDGGEVSAFTYVCSGAPGTNGTNGTNGANGANGLTSLAVTVAEPAGANCVYGGSKITSGLDSNSNGALDPSEVSSTSYACNGAPGANGIDGTSGAGLSWLEITASSVQASSNAGYLANSSSLVTVTLPVSPAIGDIVQVTGVGTGGWRIAQNAGQSVVTANLPGAYVPAGLDWTPKVTSQGFTDIASALDGVKLVAAGASGVFTSSDSGANWAAQAGSPSAARAIASSADGNKLASVLFGGQIYTSGDSGATWIARDSSRNWTDIASSADGAVLVATVDNTGAGGIYISSDSGVTWAATTAPNSGWKAVAMSSDGQKMVASTGSTIYTSTDGGANWISRRSLPATTLASSSDGRNLIAGMGGNVATEGVFTSSDSGLTWTRRLSSTDADLSKGSWSVVAVSPDGITMLASGLGQWHVSRDSGRTWMSAAHEYLGNVKGIAMSRDASTISTAVSGGSTYGIYSSAASGARTTTGTSGAISGGQYDSIELQYVGGGIFIVPSYIQYSPSGFRVQ